MKPAVLLCQIRGVAGIAARLLEQADLDLITLHEGGHAALVHCGIPHRRLDEFGDQSLLDRAVTQAEQRAVAIVPELYKPAFRAEYAQHDEVTWAALRAKLIERLSRDIAEEILLADLFCRCLAETELRALVVPEGFTRDMRTLVNLANRYGVPSIHLIHGYPYQTQNLHDVLETTRLAVFSEDCKRTYTGLGGEAERIVVTGNPLWDQFCTPASPERRKQACDALGLSPDRPVIEYILTGPHRFSSISARHLRYHLELAHQVLEAFHELSKRHPDWQFRLRPHPAQTEAGNELRARIDGLGFTACGIDASPESANAVFAADVLLCTHSNMGIEAILQEKPVINVVIDACGGPVFEEGIGGLYREDHAVLYARSREEVVDAVEGCMTDPEIQAALAGRRPETQAHFNVRNDGRATERFCDAVLDMIAHPDACRPVPERFPEFEHVFARLVPEHCAAVLVAGVGARYVADAVAHYRPACAIRVAESPDDAVSDPSETLILAVPASPETLGGLAHAATVILGFYNADEAEMARLKHREDLPHAASYTRAEMEQALAAAGLRPEQWVPVGAEKKASDRPMAWAVRCRRE